MTLHPGAFRRLLPLLALAFAALSASAQSGNAGTIRGAVTDPSGAVIPNASVHLTDKVSGFDRTTTSDATGQFVFSNVPFNPYTIDASAKGFAPLSQSVEIRSSVGVTANLVLQIAGAHQTVTVESGGDLIERRPDLPHRRGPRPVHQGAAGERNLPRLSSLVTLRPLPALQQTPTASSTASAITPPTPSPSTARQSPISRARSFPTSFRPTPFNPLKSSAARRLPNTAAKPAS